MTTIKDEQIKKKPEKNIPVMFETMDSYGEDNRFLKVKIWLMHTGENYNGSNFSKEVVEKSIPTLANTPILAFIEENSDGELDFSDHRIDIQRDKDGEIVFKYLGTAVGVIPQENNAKWETRTSSDGRELEYLTVEGLMWKKWDEPIDILKNKKFVNQSMELSENYTGTWDEDGVFHFDSFQFFGACLLGEDVMPAMRNSTAEVHFSKNNELQNTIESKLNEFYTLFSQDETEGGDTNMEKEAKTPETKEVEAKEVEKEAKDSAENKGKEVSEKVEEPEKKFEEDDGSESSPETETEVGAGEGSGGTEENPETVVDPEEEEKLVDTDDEGNAVDAMKKPKREVFDTTKFEEELEQVKKERDSLLKKVEDLENEVKNLAEERDTLRDEIRDVREAEAERERYEVASTFSTQLSKEEIQKVLDESKELTAKDVENKLFALLGKKNYAIQKSDTVANIKIPTSKKEDSNPFKALEKYL